MINYIDTSVLVSYYYPERYSEKIEKFLMTKKDFLISVLTELEFQSAISKKVRAKEIELNNAKRIIDRFLLDIKEGYYTKLSITEDHFIQATNWIAQFNTSLRTLDALHLAFAYLNRALIITTDNKLSQSAIELSIDVLLLNFED